GMNAFSLDQGMEATITKAAALVRQLYQPGTQCFIIGIGLALVMQDASGQPDKPAGTALGEFDLLHHRRHRFALGLRAQYFPLTTTFKASMSSMASASSFFSFAFSDSRSRSR